MSEQLLPSSPARRRFLAICSAAGLGHSLFPGALLALATTSSLAQAPNASKSAPDSAVLPKITPEMIDAAAAIAGLTLSSEQKQIMLEGLTSQREDVVTIRGLDLQNATAPAFIFDPVPSGMTLDTAKQPLRISPAPHIVFEQNSTGDAALEALAFLTAREQAELLRTRRITSTALTKMYLARLKRLDSQLHFVITLTEDRALAQASAADREIASGHYRGPLHGMPWGAKDLLAVKGYPTTWGAAGFEHQTFDYDATVVQRLDAAGAVLLAKLTMGALAQGDLWGYPQASGKPGARTRNPWNPRQGSSGSSAGSASAVAAGCVSFALGTETLGSHLLALHPLRRHRPPPHLRPRPAHRSHGPLLDHGQDRPHRPLRRRRRPCPLRYLRPRNR